MAKNNRTSTIILVVAAIAVWCVVGYRVFRWIWPKETPVAVSSKPVRADDGQGKDSLLLNYKDPFLGDIKTPSSDNTASAAGPVQEPVMPALSYKGLIKDSDGTVNAMISYGGHTEGYSRGSVIDGVRIVEIHADYIIIKWRGSEYILKAR